MKLLALTVLFLLVGCTTSIKEKSWVSASSVDAFKITVSDVQGAQLAPCIIAGGGSHAIGFQKAHKKGETVSRMMGYSRRKSFWSLFSSDKSTSGNVSFFYIGEPGETPKQSASIINAASKVVNQKIQLKEEN